MYAYRRRRAHRQGEEAVEAAGGTLHLPLGFLSLRRLPLQSHQLALYSLYHGCYDAC